MYVYVDILLTNTAESVKAAQLADRPARKAPKGKKTASSAHFDKIPFMLDETAYRYDLLKWLELDYKAAPHVLWCGRTGSGKTVAAKLLLARTSLLAPPHFQPV
jgi:ABC-type transport system involved in cytochrome bd biosynthesis fused ATPase/permease subunit